MENKTLREIYNSPTFTFDYKGVHISRWGSNLLMSVMGTTFQEMPDSRLLRDVIVGQQKEAIDKRLVRINCDIQDLNRLFTEMGKPHLAVELVEYTP